MDGFRSPRCPWCAGNRGLEYGTTVGQPVRAAAAGTVRFAGPVARVNYVVVEHPSGLRTSYGPLEDTSVAVGDSVRAGAVLGRSGGTRLFFGVRPSASGWVRWGSAAAYLDPGRFLLRRVAPVRLVPTDGSPPPPAPDRLRRARLTCTARLAGR